MICSWSVGIHFGSPNAQFWTIVPESIDHPPPTCMRSCAWVVCMHYVLFCLWCVSVVTLQGHKQAYLIFSVIRGFVWICGDTHLWKHFGCSLRSCMQYIDGWYLSTISHLYIFNTLCNIVMVLTAPEECSPQMKQFRTKQIPKTTAGYKVAVCRKKKKQNLV